MTRLSRHFSLAILLAPYLVNSVLAQGPVITELLARNDNGLQDEDGDHSDWIEVHNIPGAGPVNLSGWALTDDPGDLTKWTFPPGTNLSESGFLVIFASSKNRRDPAGTLHTNFKLSGSGEYLALVDPAGTIASAYTPEFPPQTDDISYGLSFNPAPTTEPRFFTVPTPNAPNSAGGPPAWDTMHTPHQPSDNDDLVVSVRAPTLGASAPSVDLVYRIMHGAQQSVPMFDDGVAPDAFASDGIYTSSIGSSLTGPGEMLRYKIIVSDSIGTTTLPAFLSPLGSPEWHGTVVLDPSLGVSPLPVWEWFIQNPSAANTSAGTRCSLWIEGEFYDNVKVNRRGSSSAGYPRKSFKFDFNPDHRPVLQDLGVPIDEANLNTHWSDKAHVRQSLSYRVYEEVGSLSSTSFPVRLEQNGTFYSVQTFIEEPDRFYLERAGEDPNGALYKMYNTFSSGTSGVEKVTRTHENNSDLQAIVSAVQQVGPGMEDYLFDNLDVPRVINYLAASWLIHENDHCHKNYYFYRDSDGDGEWEFIPWDKDLTWGRNYHLNNGGVLNDRLSYNHFQNSHPLIGDSQHPNSDGFWNRLIDRIYGSPRLREMYLRRLRTVCDQFLQPPGTPASELWMENLIEDAYTLMAPDVALDAARWGVPTWQTSRTFLQAKDRMISGYVVNRRGHLYGSLLAANGGLVPGGNSRRTSLRVTGFDLSPASGNNDEEYIELTNDAAWATDLSGYRLEGAVTMTLPPGTVVEAGGQVYLCADSRAFRERTTSPHAGEGHFVVGPFSGNLAAGETLLLRDPAGRVRARIVL